VTKNDRLLAVLMALQQGPVSAQELAGKFEVSRRTILRDMESLSEMGVPLYAVSGPGGGFRLMEGYAMPPLQLNARETLAVLFSLSAVARLADTPFDQARWTAIDKIRSALPSALLEQAAPTLERLELQVPRRHVKSPHLAELLEHTSRSRRLRVLYRSEKRRRWLELHPRRMYAAHGFWYCVAYSPEHGEERTFRVDRIEELEALEDRREAAVVPESGSNGGSGSESRQEAGSPVKISAKLSYRGALLVEQDEHIG